MVLLKVHLHALIQHNKLHLHSNMVLLKGLAYLHQEGEKENLHSNMVLLKVGIVFL